MQDSANRAYIQSVENVQSLNLGKQVFVLGEEINLLILKIIPATKISENKVDIWVWGMMGGLFQSY